MPYNFWVISQPRGAIGHWNYSDINFCLASVFRDTGALAFWRAGRKAGAFHVGRRGETSVNARGVFEICSRFAVESACFVRSGRKLCWFIATRELDVYLAIEPVQVSSWTGDRNFDISRSERINNTHVRLCIELREIGLLQRMKISRRRLRPEIFINIVPNDRASKIHRSKLGWKWSKSQIKRDMGNCSFRSEIVVLFCK